MDVRLLFPSEYVAASDLIEAQRKTGRNGVALTISSVAVESLKTNRGSEKKPIVHFKEMLARHAAGNGPEKKLVLNKTNAKAIAKMYGFETSAWAGKKIILFPTQCEAFGETVDCVRVMVQKDSVPQANGSPEPPEKGEDTPEFDPETGEIIPNDLPFADDPEPVERVETKPTGATRGVQPRVPPAHAPSPRAPRSNGGTKTEASPATPPKSPW